MIKIKDEQTYIEIVEKYSDMLYRIAFQSMRSTHDAEDIVQDTFLKLLNQKDNIFNDMDHLKAWMIRVTINRCKDYKKAAFRNNEVELKDTLYMYDKKRESLLDEIMKLSFEDRNIIYLYYYEGYSIKEIADILGKKQNTINSRITRGRKKLKIILEEEGYESIRRINE